MHQNRGKGFADKRPAIRGGGIERMSHMRTWEFNSEDNNEDYVTVQTALNHKAPA